MRADARASLSWAQARLIELLLRYDAPRFAAELVERATGGEEHPWLRRHRELAALWHLRGELFDDLLPRIKRGLSFAAPSVSGEERLPARGRVDWRRTATRSHDMPGESPLEAHTRRRRRLFSTPENLLVAVTLMEYRQLAEQILDGELVGGGTAALRHPVHDIVALCERELALPPFAGLRGEAERIVAGEGDLDADGLSAAVSSLLPAGRASAYDGLLAWRERLEALRLATAPDQAPAAPALGSGPGSESAVYEAWLFYELADLLRRRDLLTFVDGDRLHFRWGDGASDYTVRLRPSVQSAWEQVRAVRYGLLVERDSLSEPSPGVRLGWREGGYAVSALFLAPDELSAAVRGLLGDLQLGGARRGALVYAHGLAQAGVGSCGEHAVALAAGLDSPVPDAQVQIQQIAPMPGEQEAHAPALARLLDEATAAIRQRAPVACHGVFLDVASAAERAAPVTRDGMPLGAGLDEVLICPKPHVGPWRVDLVSRAAHCCRDHRLCHIAGQAGARPPVRPPRTAEELLRELGHLVVSGAPGDADEIAVEAVAQRVEELSRRFAELAGDFSAVTYEGRLRDAGMDRTLHLLGAPERDSMALAAYLVDKLDRIGAGDFSAPTIHLARVLEREIQRRVMAIPGISPADFPHGRPTLGSLAGTRRRRPEVWAIIVKHAAGVWDGRVDPDDPDLTITLDQFVAQLAPVVAARNQAAHTTPITRQRYGNLFRDVCRGGPIRVGALNVLLLAWRLGGRVA